MTPIHCTMNSVSGFGYWRVSRKFITPRSARRNNSSIVSAESISGRKQSASHREVEALNPGLLVLETMICVTSRLVGAPNRIGGRREH
jgi:hypothetical protein